MPRDDAELTPERLRSLKASLLRNGLQVPVEFFRDAEGHPILTKGYRRVTALTQLAGEEHAGFSAAMEVIAVEVSQASEEELLIRSVEDNVNRKTYSWIERVRAAKLLDDNGVSQSVAAETLDVSVPQYRRDLLVSQHQWMLTLIGANCIVPTTAAHLLEVANKANRVGELEEHLSNWVTATKEHIEADPKRKKLTPAKQLVRAYMSGALVDQWTVQLQHKDPLTNVLPEPAIIRVDEKDNLIFLDETDLNVNNAPLEDLVRLVMDFEKATNLITPILEMKAKKRSAQPTSTVDGVQRTGVTFLRKLGLGDIIDKVEQAERTAAAQPHAPTSEEDESVDSMEA